MVVLDKGIVGLRSLKIQMIWQDIIEPELVSSFWFL
jgi:hypothetical protein